jgi:hypothetical protein
LGEQRRWARASQQAQAADAVAEGAGCFAGDCAGLGNKDKQGGAEQRRFALPEGDQRRPFFGGERNVFGLTSTRHSGRAHRRCARRCLPGRLDHRLRGR